MRNPENSWLWLYKILAGALIVIVLGVHFIVNHAVAPGGLLSYTDVIRYYQNPWIVVMEVGFLVLVVSHAFIGLRSIVIDLHPSPALLRVITWLLSASGLAAIGYGSWLALTIASRG